MPTLICVNADLYQKALAVIAAAEQDELLIQLEATSDPILDTMVWTKKDAIQAADGAVANGDLDPALRDEAIADALDNFTDEYCHETVNTELENYMDDYRAERLRMGKTI